MFIKIWERYLLQQLLKTFLFFLAISYFLYVVIDYSSHMEDFVHGKTLSSWGLLLYYSFQFIKRAEILLPLALMIATIRVLCSLNVHKELVAFQSAGVPWKLLLRPFYFTAFGCTLVMLVFNQYALPSSLNSIDKFYETYLRHSYRGKRNDPFHVMHLDDHSRLIYQYHDRVKEAFFDVIWMRSPDEIWRIKTLHADPNYPLAQHVDYLTRTTEGYFEKRGSFETLLLKDLKWHRNLPRKGSILFEHHSISSLYRMLKEDKKLSAYQSNELVAHLLFKLIMPFLSPLIILGCTPFCINPSRHFSQPLIYALALFGFVAFIALMDAAVILGENSTLSPYIVIFSPPLLVTFLFGWNYLKTP